MSMRTIRSSTLRGASVVWTAAAIGAISAADLGKAYSTAEARSMIHNADTNGDGQITFEELAEVILQEQMSLDQEADANSGSRSGGNLPVASREAILDRDL